ncbi:hypothetical protein HMPREF0290_0129 [Corynebacterium efficiens YS-314]|uniref:Uncharacterized protein n=1 Tax=Corynebacterium efficiens (strain DSM 44549 / YS-314 / AJ 12310 / JCM 11189 / NBRC 100395) TaxID=196164 RepID=Q8FLX3_COREF|nr:hypothetical protein HMPREF0290_0129 [Corynebacterium efficiens YS-314]BAC19546.1 hypothetical protein [Corynebacterium efficiens YS-314]
MKNPHSGISILTPRKPPRTPPAAQQFSQLDTYFQKININQITGRLILNCIISESC